MLAEPDSTGSVEYDTLLGTAMAYALVRRGLEAPAWTLQVPTLEREWMWDGHYTAGDEFVEFIRAETPAMFRAKNLLLRERDLIAP